MKSEVSNHHHRSISSIFKKKTLVFLRHGQATHNPRAEAEKEKGCSHETFMKLMQEDDQFDAELTPLGIEQAMEGKKKYEHLLVGVDLVVSSPLSRALKTADLTICPENGMPTSSCTSTSGIETSHPKRVCIESLREINGLLLNAKRRAKIDLEERFHERWNFDSLTEEDKTWTEKLEEYDDCSERGYQSLLWLLQRSEDKILVVAHGGILRFTMDLHPLVTVDNSNRFSNCEMRQYEITFDWKTDEEYDLFSNKRPLIILTEVSADDRKD